MPKNQLKQALYFGYDLAQTKVRSHILVTIYLDHFDSYPPICDCQHFAQNTSEFLIAQS